MWRVVALLVTIGSVAFGENTPVDPGSFDIEPPLLIPDRDKEEVAKAEQSPPREINLAKLEKEFERAKKNLNGLDRLLKMGALSKVEVEQRRLRVIHLEFELANARLVSAKEQMLQKDKQSNAGEIAKTEVTPVETNLALAIEAAHVATNKREQADLDAAEANLQRQQKLVALGSARKSDVVRAEQKLAGLRAQKSDGR